MIWKQIWHLQNLQNKRLCEYLHFCQNAVPTVLTFSAIVKLYEFKTNVSVKKETPQL